MINFTITPEELNELPIGGWEGETILIDKPEGVASAIQAINKETIIGIDTETRPAFIKGVVYHISLIQIATRNCVYLFRINHVGLSEGILKIFESEAILKVGIDLNYDIALLKKMKRFTPRNVIELNSYCKQKGFLVMGLRKLSAILLGIRISKRQQTSNWEAETYTPAQIRYAATDAWACRELFVRMIEHGMYPDQEDESKSA
jgi:ribonuclease D